MRATNIDITVRARRRSIVYAARRRRCLAAVTACSVTDTNSSVAVVAVMCAARVVSVSTIDGVSARRRICAVPPGCCAWTVAIAMRHAVAMMTSVTRYAAARAGFVDAQWLPMSARHEGNRADHSLVARTARDATR